MSKETSTSGGVGFTGILTLIFITLKLTGNIGWSWFWVLSPLWGWCLLVIVLAALLYLLEK